MVFFAALTVAFPFFHTEYAARPRIFLGTKKASFLHRSGRQGKDLPKKQMRARQRSRIILRPENRKEDHTKNDLALGNQSEIVFCVILLPIFWPQNNS